MIRLTTLLALLVLCTFPAKALTTEQLAALRESVREMCLIPDRAGDYLSVQGEAKIGLPVTVKIIKGDVSGKISYDTWKGIPITLDKYKTDPRQCALEMMKLLLPTFQIGSVAADFYTTRPKLISPKYDAKFDDYPRLIKYSWNPVPSASKYVVEVQYFDSGAQEWKTLPAGTGVIESSSVSASSGFVGAQPGRWRVTAINERGDSSQSADWRPFLYQK